MALVYCCGAGLFCRYEWGQKNVYNDGSVGHIFTPPGHWKFERLFFGFTHNSESAEVVTDGLSCCDTTSVFWRNRLVWCMHCHGTIFVPSVLLIKFLPQAFQAVGKTTAWRRGPEGFEEDTFSYTSKQYGALDAFTGTEQVKINSEVVYRGSFLGGIIN